MRKQLPSIALSLSFLGALGCFLLLYRAHMLQNDISGGWDICKMLFATTCDGALLHSLSFQLGMPLSGIGLIYFGAIGILLIIAKPTTKRIASFLSSVGVGMSLLLSTLLIVSDLHCSLCLLTHAINGLLLISLVAGNWRSTWQANLKYSTVLIVLLALGLFTQIFIVGNSDGLQNLKNLRQSYVDYNNAHTETFQWPNNEHLTGNPNAEIQVVVFSSFQCPSCKSIVPSLQSLEDQYRNDVSVRHVNYPLSSTCNSKMQYDSQPQSCEAALAAIAAGYQNKFKEYHDKIFESDQQLSTEELRSFASALNLDMTKWEQDKQSEQAVKDLQYDIEIGNKLNISGTPTIYINGKKLPSNNGALLHVVVSKILSAKSS